MLYHKILLFLFATLFYLCREFGKDNYISTEQAYSNVFYIFLNLLITILEQN